MTVRWLLVALPIVAFAGCDRPSADPHAHEEHEDRAADAAESEHAPSEAGTLAIDVEMLRDLRITTQPAEARPAGEGVTVLGEVGVNEDAYAEVAPVIAARIVELLAKPGDRVEPGQPLAWLESPELGAARADAEAAAARVRLAKLALARKRELVAERIVAGRELQEAEAEAAAAEAALRAARGALAALGAREDGGDAAMGPRFALVAPTAGTVLERGVVQGQIAEPGRAAFRIGELGRLWLTVHAFERDAIRIAPGARARIEFPALPGRSYDGTVTLVGSEVDTSSRTIPLRVDLENREGLLRPGMSATAWLPLGDSQTSIVTVPAAALQSTREGWAVFLPREEGVFEVRSVGRGRDLGGEVEVVSGLAAGERVVVDGAFLLKAEREKARGGGGHHDH